MTPVGPLTSRLRQKTLPKLEVYLNECVLFIKNIPPVAATLENQWCLEVFYEEAFKYFSSTGVALTGIVLTATDGSLIQEVKF
jgi:hypothetical protein